MKRIQIIILAVVLVVVIGLSFGNIGLTPQPAQAPTPSAATTQSPTPTSSPTALATIDYPGQTGKTALELLNASHQVKSQTSSLGVLVQSIDGHASDNNHYWLFYINGVAATVGADQYQTKDGQQIEWRLEAAQ